MLAKLKKKSIVRRFVKDKLKAVGVDRNMNTSAIKTVAILMEESQLLKSNATLNAIQQEFKIPLDNIRLLVFKPFDLNTK